MVTLTLLDSQTFKPLRQWNFPAQSLIRIGRSRNNDLVLANFSEISRYHLELRRVEVQYKQEGIQHLHHYWKILNLGQNGTLVNGILISQTLLYHNALIQLTGKGPLLKFQIKSKSSNQAKINLSPTCNHVGNSPQNLFCIHCGKPLVEEEFICHYQILKIIGTGGMGTTYLAYDRREKIPQELAPNLLVLKEMNADLMKITKARELFEREARILKSLNHPQIPKYYEFFWQNNRKYLAMELIHGQNLEELIYQTGPTTEAQAIMWMLQVCDILIYLHSLTPPLVHRDIKPANLILRNVDRQIMLLDFGAVKEIGTPLNTCIGAEGYSAPEQNLGKPCTQSDIYALGATLIFLLTGENLSKYLKYHGSEENFTLANVPNISPPLTQIINKTCQVNLNYRYQDVPKLAKDLRVYLEFIQLKVDLWK